MEKVIFASSSASEKSHFLHVQHLKKVIFASSSAYEKYHFCLEFRHCLFGFCPDFILGQCPALFFWLLPHLYFLFWPQFYFWWWPWFVFLAFASIIFLALAFSPRWSAASVSFCGLVKWFVDSVSLVGQSLPTFYFWRLPRGPRLFFGRWPRRNLI